MGNLGPNWRPFEPKWTVTGGSGRSFLLKVDVWMDLCRRTFSFILFNRPFDRFRLSSFFPFGRPVPFLLTVHVFSLRNRPLLRDHPLFDFRTVNFLRPLTFSLLTVRYDPWPFSFSRIKRPVQPRWIIHFDPWPSILDLTATISQRLFVRVWVHVRVLDFL